MDLRPCPENVNILTKSHGPWARPMGMAHGQGPWARPMGRKSVKKWNSKKKLNEKIHGVLRTARMDPSRRGVMVGSF